jgi:hypothetical protein
MRKSIVFAGAALLLATSTAAHAGGDADALIELDKAWGETRDAASLGDLLADELVALSPEGNLSKAGLIEESTSAEAPEGPYTSADYVVKFISDDVAVMTHSTSGEESHWSMHVWQKQNGAWKVAATASIPAAE